MPDSFATIELRGLGRLRTTIERKVGGLVKEPGARAFRSVVEVWMTEVKRRTPVLTGALRSTGLVQGPALEGGEGGEMQIRMVVGGPAAPYAAAVHENLTAHHRVGQAKYLESVVAEHKGTFGQEFAAMLIAGARGYAAVMGGGED